MQIVSLLKQHPFEIFQFFTTLYKDRIIEGQGFVWDRHEAGLYPVRGIHTQSLITGDSEMTISSSACLRSVDITEDEMGFKPPTQAV